MTIITVEIVISRVASELFTVFACLSSDESKSRVSVGQLVRKMHFGEVPVPFSDFPDFHRFPPSSHVKNQTRPSIAPSTVFAVELQPGVFVRTLEQFPPIGNRTAVASVTIIIIIIVVVVIDSDAHGRLRVLNSRAFITDTSNGRNSICPHVRRVGSVPLRFAVFVKRCRRDRETSVQRSSLGRGIIIIYCCLYAWTPYKYDTSTRSNKYYTDASKSDETVGISIVFENKKYKLPNECSTVEININTEHTKYITLCESGQLDAMLKNGTILF